MQYSLAALALATRYHMEDIDTQNGWNVVCVKVLRHCGITNGQEIMQVKKMVNHADRFLGSIGQTQLQKADIDARKICADMRSPSVSFSDEPESPDIDMPPKF